MVRKKAGHFSWKAGRFLWSLELIRGGHRKNQLQFLQKYSILSALNFVWIHNRQKPNLDQYLGSGSPRVSEYGSESRKKK
jgi:hypothetical protein